MSTVVPSAETARKMALFQHEGIRKHQASRPRVSKLPRGTLALADDINPFGPGDAGARNQDSMTCATLIDTFAQSVLNTSGIPNSLQGAPNLGVHFEASTKNSKSWRDQLRPSMIRTTVFLQSYSNKFLEYVNGLIECANDLSDPGNKKHLIEGIRSLQKALKTGVDEVTSTQTRLTEFIDTLTDNSNDLNTDNGNIEAAYEGDQGIIAQDQREIEVERKAIDKDNEIIAFGAAGGIVGGLLITIGLLGEFETAGLSTGLIVTGVLVDVGSGGGITDAVLDIKKNSKDINKRTAEIAKFTAEIATINNVSTTLTGLLAKAKAALSAANELLKAWQTMYSYLDKVLEDANNLDATSFWVAEDLRTAIDDWTSVQTSCKAIADELVDPNIKQVKVPMPSS